VSKANIRGDAIPKFDNSTYKRALIKLIGALGYDESIGGNSCALRLVALQFKFTEDGLGNSVMYERISHAFNDKEQASDLDLQPSQSFKEGGNVLISSDLEDEPNAGV